MRKNVQLILTLIIVLCIFIYHKEITNSIKQAMLLFQNNIFPSLFPFMIISPFLINYGFLPMVKKIIGPLMPKLFNLSENTSYVFIMSLLSGFPGSAIYAKELYSKGVISKEEASQLLLFCHFSNPIFILAMIPTKPLLVLIVHYTLNIIIGIILRKKLIIHKKYINNNVDSSNFFQIFTCAIKNSMENALFILGTITFFFMISAIFNTPIANICLELSQGLNYINSITISNKLKASLSGALLSFGGLSIHLQTYGIVADMDFKYLNYLKARLLHALLSFITIYIIF